MYCHFHRKVTILTPRVFLKMVFFFLLPKLFSFFQKFPVKCCRANNKVYFLVWQWIIILERLTVSEKAPHRKDYVSVKGCWDLSWRGSLALNKQKCILSDLKLYLSEGKRPKSMKKTQHLKHLRSFNTIYFLF